MTFEQYRSFCLSLPGAAEGRPFDDKIVVFTVGGKMFSSADSTDFRRINVKCRPGEAIRLRERYPAVTPGYYMNKKHWNSIDPGGGIDQALLEEWIRQSHALVVEGLPKKRRNL